MFVFKRVSGQGHRGRESSLAVAAETGISGDGALHRRTDTHTHTPEKTTRTPRLRSERARTRRVVSCPITGGGRKTLESIAAAPSQKFVAAASEVKCPRDEDTRREFGAETFFT